MTQLRDKSDNNLVYFDEVKRYARHVINSPYAFKRLKLVESQPDGLQIQLGPERKMVELVFG